MSKKINEIQHNKIKKEIEKIEESNKYEKGKHKGFIHLFLKAYCDLKDEEVKSYITDGPADESIDAFYIKENVVNLFQFKFPKTYNPDKVVCAEEFKQFVNNSEYLITSKNVDNVWNEEIINLYDKIKNIKSPKFNLFFVSYAKENDNVKNFAEEKKGTIISDINIISKDEIDEILNKKIFNKLPDVELKYDDIKAKEVEGKYNDVEYKILNTYCCIVDFYHSICEKKENIFSANVRYSNKRSNVFKEIKKTLNEYPEKFTLLNNGITILCEKIDRHPTKQTITLNKASIINGAHTSQAILEVIEETGTKKYDGIKLFVRIIEISNDAELINEIINALNTHTKLNNTYKYIKDPRMVDLQKEFNEKSEKYYLELKDNDYQNNIGKHSKKKLIKLIDLIQYYVAYYNVNNNASYAKTNKSKLLSNQDLMKEFLENIDYDKANTVIEKYFEIKEVQKQLVEKDEKMAFVKTADILILFILGLYNSNEHSNNCNIYRAIDVIKDYIQDCLKKDPQTNTANITKSKSTFNEIKQRIQEEIKN